MKSEIWKFPLRLDESQDIEMPAGAKILSLGKDPQGNVCVWAAVAFDPDEPKAKRRILLAGTGWELDSTPTFLAGQFLGTVNVGQLVWHFFDGGER